MAGSSAEGAQPRRACCDRRKFAIVEPGAGEHDMMMEVMVVPQMVRKGVGWANTLLQEADAGRGALASLVMVDTETVASVESICHPCRMFY